MRNKVVTLRVSQSNLTYAVLIAVVAAALAVMTSYLIRRTQGSFKKAADAYGLEEQYDPGG